MSGFGGGLLQSCSRDALRSALKCNWVDVDGEVLERGTLDGARRRQGGRPECLTVYGSLPVFCRAVTYIRISGIWHMDLNGAATLVYDTADGAAEYSGRLRRSLRAIRAACSGNADSVLLVLFGSRARGTASTNSDADFYHIVRKDKWAGANYGAISRAGRVPGGLRRYTVLTDTTRTFRKYGNLYGTAEYWALREGHVIYEARGADRVKSGVVDYSKADVRGCAPRWLSLAKRHLSEGRTYTDKHGRVDADFTCHMARKSIEDSVKAVLLNARVKFPFVRDLRALCDMQPLASRMTRGLDLERVDGWHMRWKRRLARPLAQDDYDEAIRSAQSIYEKAASMVI